MDKRQKTAYEGQVLENLITGLREKISNEKDVIYLSSRSDKQAEIAIKLLDKLYVYFEQTVTFYQSEYRLTRGMCDDGLLFDRDERDKVSDMILKYITRKSDSKTKGTGVTITNEEFVFFNQLTDIMDSLVKGVSAIMVSINAVNIDSTNKDIRGWDVIDSINAIRGSMNSLTNGFHPYSYPNIL